MWTVKENKPTGKYKSFYESSFDLKRERKKVGILDKDKDDGKFKIILYVYKDEKYTDNNPNCVWKRITLKGRFDNKEQVIEFLKKNDSVINNMMKLYVIED